MREDEPRLQIRVKPFFKWFDLWLGVYIDTENQAIYICPFPTIGIKIHWWRETLNQKSYADGWKHAVEYVAAREGLSREVQDSCKSIVDR